MIRVRNKKVVAEVARTTCRANRKQNLLAAFAILLTTFLIAVVLALGVSYWNTVSLRQVRMNGMDYDIELTEPREDQIKKIRSMDEVRYAGVAVKCAVLEQYLGRMLDKTRLYWLDETCWEKQTIPALERYEGSYPEKEHEIMLSWSVLKAMGIEHPKKGMVLPLDYFTLEEGSNEEILEQDFILTGWFVDYTGRDSGYISRTFFERTGVKQTDFTQGCLKISLNHALYSEDDIVKMQNNIDLGYNQIIEADYDMIESFCKTAIGLAGMLAMIFISGYLFIYNTMYISISKNIRYYGQLKTIGMTSVQLKGIIYRQALGNFLIGAPPGLAAAALLGRAVIPEILHLLNASLGTGEVVQAQPWVFITAGAFAFLTNIVSSRKPAKMTGECSPIEAIRYTGGLGSGKAREREGGGIVFMAFQNMFRNKKQAVVIFLSLIIAVSVFLIVNVYIRENDAKLILDTICSRDIEFKNETTLEDDRQQLITDDRIARTEAVPGVKRVRRVSSTAAVVPYQEEIYGTYLRELYESRYSPGNYEEDMVSYQKNPENGRFMPRFIGIDEAGFEVLNESLGNVLDKTEFENGETAVLVSYFTDGDSGLTGKTVRFSLPEGREPEKEYSVRIAAVGDGTINPAYFAGGYIPDIIVSEKYAKKLLGETFAELIDIEYQRAYSKETEQKVKEVFAGDKKISWESKLERYDDMKNSEMQVKVLGNSIGIIMAVLAVLNYLNMMAAGIQNRMHEFAILESIGMTSGQIRKMLTLEGAGYALISIMAAILTGIPFSYVVFQNMNIYRIPYTIPWRENLFLFTVIACLCMIMPALIYRKTQKESMIDRLRRSEEQ
ncbi:ABC transporter permease [Ruminococcus sp. OA3]|uniref:ABC transporter permease n=1 Tax=Ruminococcus sp. OA3 TaxID=2914164 RepID=UPI001F05096C|nr:ABC transporter permease [Ruminococcus sp. OA3]MCH1982000.1 ABC transporter permease [Ruminococcus sp. OA3]